MSVGLTVRMRAEEHREEIGVEAARQADEHHREGEAAGEEHRQGGIARERARVRRRSMPTAPATVTTRAPRSGEIPRKRPSATPARATWAELSAMKRQPSRHQEHPDGGADDGRHRPAAKARCMEVVGEEFGQGVLLQCSCEMTRTAGP